MANIFQKNNNNKNNNKHYNVMYISMYSYMVVYLMTNMYSSAKFAFVSNFHGGMDFECKNIEVYLIVLPSLITKEKILS